MYMYSKLAVYFCSTYQVQGAVVRDALLMFNINYSQQIHGWFDTSEGNLCQNANKALCTVRSPIDAEVE